MRRWWAIIIAGLALPGVSGAQRADAVRAGVARHVSPPLAPLASAIIPGSGQFLQRRDRALAYAAVEAVGWWKLIHDIGERNREAAEFKALARTVARAHLSPGGPDGDWTYYEAMRDYQASGDYSKSETGLVPERNPSTFNGYTWQVIAATTDTTNDMTGALALYAQRAAKPEMLWTWENAGFQWDLFKRSTEKRNDANAAVGLDASVIVLNHLLSMVDAFAVFRLDTRRMSDGRTAVGAKIQW